MKQPQALHRALLRHIASTNDLHNLLVHIDKKSTGQQHQVIQRARTALHDTGSAIRAVAGMQS